MRWCKPDQKSGLYAASFTANVDLTGSRYGKPTAGTRALQVNNVNGQVRVNITGGNLTVPVTATFTWARITS